MPAKRLLACLLVCSPATGFPREAESNWLTIVGDAKDAGATTIQIDPRPTAIKGALRWMTVRLSRSKQRISTDGLSFRSFSSEVEFDCNTRKARFTKTQFFDGPLWTAPGKYMDYPPTMVRPMVFREIEPNPIERVITAACGTKVLAPAPR